MRKIQFVLVLLAIASTAGAQKPYFSVRTLRMPMEGKDTATLTFPFFKGGEGAAAEKINAQLQLWELQAASGDDQEKLFDRVAMTDSPFYQGVFMIRNTIVENTPRALSLCISSGAEGGTLYYFQHYYTFNPRNGDRIQLQDLFTEAGYEQFKTVALARRLETFITDSALLSEEGGSFGAEFVQEAIRKRELEDFYLKGDSIYIDDAAAASRFATFPLLTGFEKAEIDSLLNPYGQAVMGISKDDLKKYRSENGPQLYSGTVGKESVLMALTPCSPGQNYGRLFFAASGKSFTLNGDCSSLGAQDEKSGEVASLELSFSGGGFSGNWKSGSSTEVVKLSRK